MIADWKKEIAIAWIVQNEIDKLDVDRIWKYYVPRVRATEQELIQTEAILGMPLDLEYRNFLKFANGWQCFHRHIDLFGTKELTGVAELQRARILLEQMASETLEQSSVKRSELQPIAVATQDVDLFVVRSLRTGVPGEVIWFANEEVERYATFDHFFLAMVDYNRVRLEKFKRGEMRIHKS